jgi:hypothetical protein
LCHCFLQFKGKESFLFDFVDVKGLPGSFLMFSLKENDVMSQEVILDVENEENH